MESDKCPRCNSENSQIVDYAQGEIVCSQCGLVFDLHLIDEHNEQRFFSKNCSSNGISAKELSRTSAPINTFNFGDDSNEIKLIGKKTKFSNENKKYNNYFGNNNNNNKKNLTEEEKKMLKRQKELKQIDYELKKLCSYFNINKMIYEATKGEVIRLYEYGQIKMKSKFWKLILGIILNYTLKLKTSKCFSKEEISGYFKCDINILKGKVNDILLYLSKAPQISQNGEESKSINLTSENKVDIYLSQLKEDVDSLIRSTKIKTITGIEDSFDIISIYINNNIFNIEAIPSICLAGGALIFCVKLYNIQFTITTKNKNVLDKSYNMNTPEEEQKLIYYIAKKCGSGINADKLKAVYMKMIKYKNVLSDKENYLDFLDNLPTINKEKYNSYND